MNLDVNVRHVHQENYTKEESSTIKDAIFKENDDTFQNSAIHLLFYEKIISEGQDPEPNLNALPTPELTSISYCKFKKHPTLNVEDKAYRYELLLVLQGVTAKFVTKENYNLLLFILGQRYNNSAESHQSFQRNFDSVQQISQWYNQKF